MASFQEILAAAGTPAQFCCDRTLNLYKTPTLEGLVTQLAKGRQVAIVQAETHQAVKLRSCEDDYPGWLPLSDLAALTPAPAYVAPVLDAVTIQARIPQVIAFAQAAMAIPNHYHWGGTVAPNYDCSGLTQSAFAAAGVWLPRDSYQQEAFTERVAEPDLQPGDLIFFGPPERTTHVALHLAAGRYLHSSGQDQGRNGIGIDSLRDRTDPISQKYFEQLRCCGRVVRSYPPTGSPIALRTDTVQLY
ncbi:MAG: C40 family peptidase [Cyanobacteria bacterium P01_A01_bin.105]